MSINFETNVFPLFHPAAVDDVKDPCPVFDGTALAHVRLERHRYK